MRYTIIPAFLLLTLSSSCSWYKDLERSLVDGDEKQEKAKNNRPVPRAQYDQLLVKYEELSKKYEQLKENPNAGQTSLVDELQKTQGENFTQPSASAETETVNVFGDRPGTTVSVPSDIESQINIYRRGLSLKGSHAGEATKIFQQLETQGIPAVRVKAKFQMGELLFSKQQYDLALQVFEDVITKHAHSGVVLDALKFAVVCSDKLGLQSKKDQYASMLNDVFETR